MEGFKSINTTKVMNIKVAEDNSKAETGLRQHEL